jgi:hypothetical protein
MKVSGFSFVKNAVLFDFPIVEAITSILPICNEFVIAVGHSTDGTLDLIKSIESDKIRIVETEWNESIQKGGAILAVETNKAFAAVSENSDWAFYIQGDEVVHEKHLDIIKNAMLQYKDDAEIDGLLFKYHHFYASYDYVGASSQWYKNEIRVIKNDKSIYSYRDAQGFRKGDNEKLNVLPIDAYIYHYGWVREPELMHRKNEQNVKYGFAGKWSEPRTGEENKFDYSRHVDQLRGFDGSHPEVMKKRIAQKNWRFDHDISLNRKNLKEMFKEFCKKYLGLDFYYRNYKIHK